MTAKAGLKKKKAHSNRTFCSLFSHYKREHDVTYISSMYDIGSYAI